MELQAKLLAIQCELVAPKNQYNAFGKYHYRSCEDILEAVKPLCKKHGAVLTVTDTVECCGDRVYIVATATLADTESDKSISVRAFAREAATKKGMDDAQVTGSTSSYARKYALNGLFCIDDCKDPDVPQQGTQGKQKTQDPQKEQARQQAAEKISPDQVAILKENAENERVKKALVYYKVSRIEDLSRHQADKIFMKLGL